MEPCDKDKGCAKRQKIAGVHKNGAVYVIQRCTEPKAELYAQEVTPQQCNGCPFRVTPPTIPIVVTVEISTAKKKQPALSIIPLTDSFVPCDDRRQQTVIKCCGMVSYRRVCSSKVCEYNSKEVTESICAQCPLRVVGGVVQLNLDNGSK